MKIRTLEASEICWDYYFDFIKAKLFMDEGNSWLIMISLQTIQLTFAVSLNFKSQCVGSQPYARQNSGKWLTNQN